MSRDPKIETPFEQNSISVMDIPRIVKDHWTLWTEHGVRKSPLLISEPGVGKTGAVGQGTQDIANESGLQFVRSQTPEEHQLGFCENQFANQPQETISGMPWVNYDENVQRRALANVYPRSGRGIWVADEPLHANYAQRFIAQLTHGGKLDDFYAMPDWLMVLTGNGYKHASGVVKMYKHLQNRITVYNVKPHVESSQYFDLDRTPEVYAYLKWFPQNVSNFDPKSDEPYASMRSWDTINSFITAGMNPVTHFPMFQGTIGYAMASDFKQTYTAMTSMPNIEEWLADPIGHKHEIASKAQHTPHMMCAFVFVMLRRYMATRDIASCARAITVLDQVDGVEKAEQVGSLIGVMKDLDNKVNDGQRISDTAEYARFMANNSNITFN